MSDKIKKLVYIKNSLGESIFGKVEVESISGLDTITLKEPRILTRTQTGDVGIGHFDGVAIGLAIPEICIPVTAIVAFVDCEISTQYEAIKTSYEASLAGVKVAEPTKTVDISGE